MSKMHAAEDVDTSEEDQSYSTDSDDEYVPLRYRRARKKPTGPSESIIDLVSFGLGAFMMAPFMVFICSAEDMQSGSYQATGLVYIAVSAPSCVIKVLSLCFQQVNTKSLVTKTLMMYMLIITGLLFLAMSQTSYNVRYAGVCIASVGMSIGEVYMLSMTTERFYKSSLISYLGGLAAGGVLGALPYVCMTSWSDINPRAALLVPIVWPTLFLLVFAILHIEYLKKNPQSASPTYQDVDIPERNIRISQFLAVYKAMDVLSLVFISNFSLFLSLGAIFTTLVFSNERELAAREDYQHYVLSSIIGQFFGRAVMSLLFGKKPEFPTIPFQVFGGFFSTFFMLLLFFASWHRFMHNIWGAFAISFFQGMSLGMLIVVSYHKLAKRTKNAQNVKVLLLTASLCETFGVLCAGLIGLHTEPSLFSHCNFISGYGQPQHCLTRAFNSLLWVNGKNM